MKYPLLGTHFVLDEEKIIRENKYDLEKIYGAIDEIAAHSGMIKIDKNTYHCKGDKNDLACLGLFVVFNLVDCEWFTRNVKEWIWISQKDGNSDLISKSKAKNLGVWR